MICRQKRVKKDDKNWNLAKNPNTVEGSLSFKTPGDKWWNTLNSKIFSLILGWTLYLQMLFANLKRVVTTINHMQLIVRFHLLANSFQLFKGTKPIFATLHTHTCREQIELRKPNRSDLESSWEFYAVWQNCEKNSHTQKVHSKSTRLSCKV